MAHRSRLSQELARRELACIVCGCTQDNACMLPDGPCRWIAPGLCSNPSCIAQFTLDDEAPQLRDPGDESDFLVEDDYEDPDDLEEELDPEDLVFG